MSTILAVDDQPEIRQMYRAVLRTCGYEIMMAGSGREALLSMQLKCPDLILLDLAMPDMDGLEFLQLIRQSPEWATLPVILMTAFVGEKQVEMARKFGASGHLVKAAFSVKELRAEIARHLSMPPTAIAG